MSKVALVTGGSRGIGFGIAEKLAAEKWDIVINGVREESAVAEPLAKLRALGVKVGYARGDVGSAEGRKAIYAATHAFCGSELARDGSPSSGFRFQVSGFLLVNNAGVAPKVRADLLETSEESYDYVMSTNLRGVFFLTQAFARDMVAAKKADPAFAGCIVNITSISATVVSINRGEYCIAKAGLSMMSQLFATRLGPDGIPVYEVRPGVIKTDEVRRHENGHAIRRGPETQWKGGQGRVPSGRPRPHMTAGVTEKYDKLIASGLCVQRRWGFSDDIGRSVAASPAAICRSARVR
jgi:NAD(P)-dependent dehydrogenase (short-subunit alcohol dehydrogenase family)